MTSRSTGTRLVTDCKGPVVRFSLDEVKTQMAKMGKEKPADQMNSL